MALATVIAQARVVDTHAEPVAGARVEMRLAAAAVDGEAFVMPATSRAISGADGVATVSAWPNARGSYATHYDLRITAPNDTHGRFEAALPDGAPVDLSGLLCGNGPLDSVLCALSFSFALRTRDKQGDITDSPADGLVVSVEPDRWDVTDFGFVVPILREQVADGAGETTFDLVSAGLMAPQVIVRARDARGLRWQMRVTVPASAEADVAACLVMPLDSAIVVESGVIYLRNF